MTTCAPADRLRALKSGRPPRILVSTWSRDTAAVGRVVDLLRQKGAEVFRFDTDLYPSQLRLTAGPRSVHLDGAHGSWDLSDLDGLWFRRDFTGFSSPDELCEAGAQREARDAVGSVLSVAAPFVLDPVDRVKRASHKLLQLRLAREVGLQIPETLVSNDPERVSTFARRLGSVVAKMHNCDLGLDENDHPIRVHTTSLDLEQIKTFDGWKMGPLIFQERIAKARELRVILVGRHTFAISVRVDGIPGAEDDWRARGEEVLKTAELAPLPAEIERRLHALRRRLGLQYGAVDLIRTPDDRYVFLEYNPVGGFEFLESVHGDAIPAALADLLFVGAADKLETLPTTSVMTPIGAQESWG